MNKRFYQLVEEFITENCIKCNNEETDEEMESNSHIYHLIKYKGIEYYIPRNLKDEFKDVVIKLLSV